MTRIWSHANEEENNNRYGVSHTSYESEDIGLGPLYGVREDVMPHPVMAGICGRECREDGIDYFAIAVNFTSTLSSSQSFIFLGII